MLKKELPVFIIVGLLTVLVDFLVYRLLVIFDIANVDLAKAIGFVAGTVFAYFANRFWTFSHKEHAREVHGSSWSFTAAVLL